MNRFHRTKAAVALSLCFWLRSFPVFAGSNPGVVEIDRPQDFSRIAALSDVHGMYDHLVPLLKSGKILGDRNQWVGGDTLLIVVGDSIDKGPDSVDVIDLWISLAAQAPSHGGRVIHLLGNHEAEFLSDGGKGKKAEIFIGELRDKGIRLSEFTDPKYARGKFLRSMPVAAKVGRWLFCHAGLYPDQNWADFKMQASILLNSGSYDDPFFIGNNSILEAKDWWSEPATRSILERRLSANGFFGLVFGHQPSALKVVGADATTEDRRIIKIDNGMAPEAGSHPGSLLIFTEPSELKSGKAPKHVTALPSGGVPQHLEIARP